MKQEMVRVIGWPMAWSALTVAERLVRDGEHHD
jgi:hypothetical protein